MGQVVRTELLPTHYIIYTNACSHDFQNPFPEDLWSTTTSSHTTHPPTHPHLRHHILHRSHIRHIPTSTSPHILEHLHSLRHLSSTTTTAACRGLLLQFLLQSSCLGRIFRWSAPFCYFLHHSALAAHFLGHLSECSVLREK